MNKQPAMIAFITARAQNKEVYVLRLYEKETNSLT